SPIKKARTLAEAKVRAGFSDAANRLKWALGALNHDIIRDGISAVIRNEQHIRRPPCDCVSSQATRDQEQHPGANLDAGVTVPIKQIRQQGPTSGDRQTAYG